MGVAVCWGAERLDVYHHQGWEWWEWTAQAVIDQSIMMQASCSVRFFILIFLHFDLSVRGRCVQSGSDIIRRIT